MFNSLYSKLALVLTGLFGLVGATIVWVALYSAEMYQHEVTQRLNSNLADHIVSQNLLLADKHVNHKALEEIFHMLMVINPSIEIYLLDTKGKILAYSAAPEKIKLGRVHLGPILQWLQSDKTFPVLGDDPRDPGGQKSFSAAPIYQATSLQGYLYVILGGEIYDNIVDKLKASYILQVGAWIIAASFLFALVAGLVLFAALTGRLKQLAAAMTAFRGGNAIQKFRIPGQGRKGGGDEIDRLGSAFQEMADQIADQIVQLQNADTQRRELVANISHDLRTPLATLRGYIETLLLKENHLSPNERHEYLETAIHSCERLSQLIDDLFELAKLDAHDIRVTAEPFNLAELAQDVVQKFKLQAENNRIGISIDHGEKLPFVIADIGLIERVLENLLGNALDHTPTGGTIRLTLQSQPADIRVQVSDTGSGIPKEKLERIFDRAFQLEHSRDVAQGHSGLGLSITKRILELHNRVIHVDSTFNVGTTFSFQLPIYYNY